MRNVNGFVAVVAGAGMLLLGAAAIAEEPTQEAPTVVEPPATELAPCPAVPAPPPAPVYVEPVPPPAPIVTPACIVIVGTTVGSPQARPRLPSVPA
jgi:hypothetical protein